MTAGARLAPSAVAQQEGPDPDSFWHGVRRFPTGVTVLTTGEAAGLRGTTASSFTFVSRRPPLISVCLTHSSTFLETIRSGGEFAVNVLVHGQAALARRFADPDRRSGHGHFAGVSHRRGARTGAPLLCGTTAWFECRVDQVLPAGDHDIVLARVLAAGPDPTGTAAAEEDRPLVYHQGRLITTQTTAQTTTQTQERTP
ncbi:flavin reductase family protein [Streptomyces ficellus]|uniref:Flavin reductase family protein n=1 Tax=Streptomyces ficellus TaxID=1977088 RepID=A0ABT7ZC27_9ACTN|nr:flavin reductase family protein [Streptomyces ficellus]MDN3297065.1 flavin reductase family protein [Streptomyces ficellus]